MTVILLPVPRIMLTNLTIRRKRRTRRDTKRKSGGKIICFPLEAVDSKNTIHVKGVIKHTLSKVVMSEPIIHHTPKVLFN